MNNTLLLKISELIDMLYDIEKKKNEFDTFFKFDFCFNYNNTIFIDCNL